MAGRPNILWIVTTQWRAQAFGHAGDPNARTPALDAFAARATRYTQAVTPHPFGPFARAALLTGVLSPQNGIRHYFDPLPRGTRTIAHAMAERGYATAYFGKWHLGWRDPTAPLVGPAHATTIVPPEARGGFALWEGFESGFLLNDPWLHGTRLPVPTRFPGYQSDVLCGRTAEWMERPGPWFCVVSLEAPHPPYGEPSGGVAARAPETLVLAANVPRGGPAEDRARRELAGYHAHAEATDRAIGRLIAAGAAADAIVVFTSVHGDMHGAHGLFRKGWPHEESVRVPLLVRRPGVTAALNTGGRSLVDLPAMTMAWADGSAEIEARLRTRISMPSVVDLPLQCDRSWRGVRTPERKLILEEDGRPWLYFDLAADPGEMNNLIREPARRPEIEALRRWI